MTYVISDIHGEYQLLRRLLDKINFSDSDKLYVLGDMIDKGDESVRTLQFCLSLKNAECILGNHEYDFLKFYWGAMRQTTDYDGVLKKLQGYFSDGRLLDWDIMDKLEQLPYYVEAPQFIGAHAGVPCDDQGNILPLANATPEQLVYDRRFKEANFVPKGKCVIYGHTPVRYLTNRDELIFYPRAGITSPKTAEDCCKIHIDTGVYLSGVLGCLCVEEPRGIYVRKD